LKIFLAFSPLCRLYYRLRENRVRWPLDKNNIFDRFGDQGFIKTIERPALTDSQKVALNRKGNELFNKGRIEEARKIYLTTGYSDGLRRVGEYYERQGKILEALKMYWLAPDKAKVEQLSAKLAILIQKLLHQEEKSDDGRTSTAYPGHEF